MNVYEDGVNKIKGLLDEFQKEYERKDTDHIDEFVGKFFIDEEDTSLVGTGVMDWNFGSKQIGDALKSYWLNDNKFLKNIRLNVDNSIITINGDSAIAVLSGRSISKIPKEIMFDDMIVKLEKNLKKTDNNKIELLNVSRKIARTLYEINLGEEFIWPFRATFLLIRRNSEWKFKHVNLSFGANNGWEAWFTDDKIGMEYKTIPVKSKESKEVDEIRSVLCRVQTGYNKRDISLLDDFSNEIFTRNENSIIFGTDEGENFKGQNAGRDLCEGDWMYWGDFDINPEKAYIDVYDNMAFVYSKAFLREPKDRQGTYNSLGDLFYNYLLPSEDSSKDKLLKMLWKTTNRVYDAEYDGIYIVPMKFSGVLIRINYSWKFQHMHFSDNIDEMPEERIIGE